MPYDEQDKIEQAQVIYDQKRENKFGESNTDPENPDALNKYKRGLFNWYDSKEEKFEQMEKLF